MSRGWYIVRTKSEHEKKVKQAIEKNVSLMGLENKIFRIMVPTEEIVELRKNKKIIKERPYFTGYVFIDMDLDPQTYWVIKNTPGVSGFLGGTKPNPLTEEEVKNLLEITEQPSIKPKPAVTFEKEESVRITDGPFRHFVGVVEEVNEEKGKLKVMVTIFGRPTPVELDFFQVEKM